MLTVIVPEALVLASARKKLALDNPPNANEFVELPQTALLPMPVANVKPGLTACTPQPPETDEPGVKVWSLLIMPTILLLANNSITKCDVAVLSTIVATIAPVVPVPGVYAGPTTIQVEPVYTFNCWLTVSYHKSPVTLLVGALAELVDLLALVGDLLERGDDAAAGREHQPAAGGRELEPLGLELARRQPEAHDAARCPAGPGRGEVGEAGPRRDGLGLRGGGKRSRKGETKR